MAGHHSQSPTKSAVALTTPTGARKEKLGSPSRETVLSSGSVPSQTQSDFDSLAGDESTFTNRESSVRLGLAVTKYPNTADDRTMFQEEYQVSEKVANGSLELLEQLSAQDNVIVLRHTQARSQERVSKDELMEAKITVPTNATQIHTYRLLPSSGQEIRKRLMERAVQVPSLALQVMPTVRSTNTSPSDASSTIPRSAQSSSPSHSTNDQNGFADVTMWYEGKGRLIAHGPRRMTVTAANQLQSRFVFLSVQAAKQVQAFKSQSSNADLSDFEVVTLFHRAQMEDIETTGLLRQDRLVLLREVLNPTL